jgi:hypothetical protein
MDGAQLRHRPETGDGGQAKGGEDLFLYCYLNFLFFEDQMQWVEGCAAAPRLKIEGWDAEAFERWER